MAPTIESLSSKDKEEESDSGRLTSLSRLHCLAVSIIALTTCIPLPDSRNC